MATTRRLLRCRHRCSRAWNLERNPWRTEAETPTSLLGSLLSAWRTQKPSRAPGKQGPHTANGTVKAIGEGTLHAIRWLLFKGRLLKHAVGLGEGGRTL